MSRIDVVKILASWLFIAGVAWLAWHYAPAILLIIATAVALAAFVALAAGTLVTLRARRA